VGLFGKKYDAFVSYKSKNVDIARLITDRIMMSGKTVWFNEYQVLLVERARFQEAIDKGIRASKYGIAFTNDDYAESEYCDREMVQLLQCCGASNVLEIQIPCEPKTRQRYPQLEGSPTHVFTGDVNELMNFVTRETGWGIEPSVGDTPRGKGDYFEGDCLGHPYRIDVSGWQLQDRSFHGGGPCYVREVEGYDIFWNLQYGEEFSPQAYEARLGLSQKNDRDLYEELCDYARSYFTRLKPGSRVAGVHLLFLDGVSHFAVTYRDGRFWKRRYSIMLSHPETSRMAEFVFTFQFPGVYFKWFCRYVELMDKLVRTLQWGEAGDRVRGAAPRSRAVEPSQAEDRLARIVEDQPMANRLNSEGLALAKKGRLREAIEAWENALKYTTLVELRGMVLFNMGRAYEKMGDIEGALRAYKESAETNPGQFNALSNIGSIYLRQNRPQEALPYLLEAAKLNPSDYVTINNLVVCHEELGNRTEAQSWMAVLRRL
jgi:tetratricopeptide (TPR) repeat protein